MMKKRTFLIVFCMLLVHPAFCQNNKRIDFDIENALKNFFADITSMTRSVDPTNPELFAKDYQGTYFFFNGNNSTVLNFLNSYKKSIGKDYFIHKFQKLSSKRKDDETSLYIVEGIIKRNHISKEDYKIKDEKVRFEVYWEDGEYANVKIMRIDLPIRIEKVFPEYSQKYSFDVSNANTHISSTGGKWSLIVDSWKWKEKIYPGISKEPERYDSIRVAFDVTPNNSLFNRGRTFSVSNSSYLLEDELKTNYSKDSREIHLELVQRESGNKIDEAIVQAGKEIYNPFDFSLSSYNALMDVRAYYAPKIGGGLSFMATLEDFRWSWGLIIMSNGDSFTELFHGNSSSTSVSVSTSTYIDITNGSVSIITGGGEKEINGYRIKETAYEPENDNYDQVEDYNNNDIDRYTSKLLLMANVGFFINNWSRINLGLGAVRQNNFSHYNKVYSLERYSYEKMDSNLPDIPDMYEPTGKKDDIWKKRGANWNFAFRPSLDFFIPISNSFFLSTGVGYTIVSNANHLSTLDYNIGILFNL